MASHPVPKPRQQATPYGAVALSARWKRDRYYLLATGPVTALGWLFPHETSFERRSANSVRRTFQPDEQPVTDPVRLDKLMTTWQRAWKARLGDAPLAVAVGPHASDPNAPATLTDLYERFIIAQRGQVAFNTLEKYHCHRARWEEALGRFLPLRDLTPERILNARALIAGKVSATTTNNSLATLKRLLRFAEDEGWVAPLRLKGIKTLRQAKYEASWWEAREVDIAMLVAAKDRCRVTATLMLGCGIYLGLRKDEIVNLRWQDLDLDRLDGHTGRPAPVCRIRCDADWKPKSGLARNVPIPVEFWKTLVACRKAEGYLLVPQQVRAKHGGRKRVYRYDCLRVWQRVLAKAVSLGVKPIRFHDLRHSYASILLMNGLSAEKVAKWLGHSSTRMVFQTYGHLLAYDDRINEVSFRTPANPSASALRVVT